MEIKRYYYKYITLGKNKNSSKNKLKKIKLFNVFCLVWYVLILLMFIEDIVLFSQVRQVTWVACIPMFFLVFISQWVHYKKLYLWAYVQFVLTIVVLTYYFSNFLYKSELLEYYYFLAPSIGLIFIDKKKINLILLGIAYICFFIPNFFFEHYPILVFNDLSVSFLFFSVYIMVAYFKNLNQKNEAVLQKKTRELEELNQFKAQFFTNVSHEIRTPITIIKGQIEELKHNVNPTPKVLNIESTVKRQVHKITEMVNDMLDLAKMNTSDFILKTNPIDINQIVKKTYISFEPLFKQKKIHFKTNIKCKNSIVNADSVYIERAINNIIINALKYTDTGEVTLSLNQKKEYVYITVSDTGIGISSENISKIFNRFYQVNNDINKSGGSGIGLAFSKEIIKKHKGNIIVKSKVDKGSDFIISLPLSKNKLPHLERTELKVKLKENKNGIKKSTTFLVVDDNKDMRTYLKSILFDVTCLEAENGEDALKKIKQYKVDFIITDYMMPKMNGYQFIEELRILKYNIPVIVLTAKVDYKSKINVLRLGVDDYMIKPFEKEELLLRIQYLLDNTIKRKKYIQTIQKDEFKNANLSIIDEIQKYVYDNCSNTSLTQDDIVVNFNISKSSLYRKLKIATGLSPNEFMTEIKLQKAKTIKTQQPNILLKQLALEVGFKHVSYFSEKYKQRFGVEA